MHCSRTTQEVGGIIGKDTLCVPPPSVEPAKTPAHIDRCEESRGNALLRSAFMIVAVNDGHISLSLTQRKDDTYCTVVRRKQST